MKTFCLSFLFLGVIASVYSTCSHSEPVAGFEEGDFLKEWALLAQTRVNEPGFDSLTCQTMKATKDGNNFKMTGHALNEKKEQIPEWVETGHMEAAGDFHMVNAKLGNFVMSVIGKTAHSIVLYSCGFPVAEKAFAWVYHTDKHMNFDAVEAEEKKQITEVLTSHGFKMDDLKMFDNTKC